MALVAMAVYDTEENGRAALTERTLQSLHDTVDWYTHRLFVVDNGSDPQCRTVLKKWADIFAGDYPVRNPLGVFYLSKNYGTAKAVNYAWRLRDPDEVAVKMDNDVVIHQDGWLDEIEEVFRRSPWIGICGLKRKDLAECPWADAPFFRSTLHMLPHQPGERWLIVEEVEHVMGTCQAYNPALLAKIGYLEQMGGLYGFDDALAAIRAKVAGFKSVFLPHVEIDHIDPGGTDFTTWKQRYSGGMMAKYEQYKQEYLTKTRPLYSPSGWDQP